MRLGRHYTSEENDVFSSFKTKTISIEICHENSELRLCIPEFEVPAHWSKRAAEHLAHHYARRAGVPAAIVSIAEEGVPESLWRCEANQVELNKLPEEQRYGGETSYRQIVHRLVGAWSYWGWSNGYFDTQEDVKSFYDEMAYLIISQHAMPASPQWCNTGLHWAYGISGDSQGGVYVDASSGELMPSDNAYERPQHHHCFIQGVSDDLSGEGGITDLWQREMRVFKNGSGSGCNLSSIRGEKETLSNGMRPAGIAPFMDISEKAAQILSPVTKQSGSRSKLSLIDCDHPDLRRVLHWRLDEHRDRIAQAMGAAKQRELFQKIHGAIHHFAGQDSQSFDPTINMELGNALVAVQNDDDLAKLVMQYVEELQACAEKPNHYGEPSLFASTAQKRTVSQLGVRVSDDFMRAANSDDEWSFKHRTNDEKGSSTCASGLLDELAHLNWLTGDGMVQFADSVEFWNGCKTAGRIRASSPNGEFLFLNDSACDVAVINLVHYLTDEGAFDIAGFEHTVRLQGIMCDIAITMAQFPSTEVAYNSYRYRPIGLSFCNMSALLMSMGYAYDSAEGRAIAAAISALMTGRGYITSAEIARELGSFEAFCEVKESMMQLMWQHHEAAFGRTQHLGTADICPSVLDISDLPDSELGEAVQKNWDLAMIQGDEFGYSNAQISMIAASPNILVLMDALTTGMMPLQRFDYRASGNKVIASGLKKLDYKTDQIEAITNYVFGHHTLFGAPGINQQALRVLNFTETSLTLIEEALQEGQSLHMAFDPLNLGERFCREKLGLSDAQIYDADFNLLHHLGFDEEALHAFERHIAGHGSVAGAPFLRSEDYAIFATADPQSEHSINVEAQIQMAAGLQPYLSGGISHKLLTPTSSSIQDHRRWMMMAWQLGLKHIELQRQDTDMIMPEMVQNAPEFSNSLSNTSSSLSKLSIEKSEIIGIIKLELEQTKASSIPVKQEQPTPVAPAPQSTTQVTPKEATNNRHRAKLRDLPNRRRGYVQEVQIGNVLVRHRVEEYEDGSLGVVHLELPDCEINLQQALQQSAAMLSIALQHGVPIEAFEGMASNTAYGPQGAVSGHADVLQAQSVMDYLLQDVLPQYQDQLAAVSKQTEATMRDIMNISIQEDDNNPAKAMDSIAS